MVEIFGMSTTVLAVIGAGGAGLVTFGTVVGIRKLIRMGQFAYHNSRLSTVGNPYVMKDEVLPLVELGSPDSLSKTVQSDLGPSTLPGSFRELDANVMKGFHSIVGDMVNSSPPSVAPFVKAYISRLEGEELKRLLRLVGNRKEPLFPVGRITEDVERQMLTSKDLNTAVEVLEGLSIAGRISSVMRSEDGIDLHVLDEAIDRHSLGVMESMEGLNFSSRRGARAFFDLLCDRFNVHYIIRSKNSGMERETVIKGLYANGGILGRPTLEQMVDSAGRREALSVLSGTYLEPFIKEIDQSDLTSLETALDRMMLEGVKGLSHTYGSTIGPTIRFLFSKEMELRNLRIIFQGAFSGWDTERTRKLLVLEEGS